MNQQALDRRLERLAVKNEATIDADKRFFERRPHRRHRVRVASSAEAETSRLLSGVVATPGGRLFIAVRKVADGARVRALFFGPDESAADLDGMGEDEAAWLFERTASAHPKLTEIEGVAKTLASACEDKGGAT